MCKLSRWEVESFNLIIEIIDSHKLLEGFIDFEILNKYLLKI